MEENQVTANTFSGKTNLEKVEKGENRSFPSCTNSKGSRGSVYLLTHPCQVEYRGVPCNPPKGKKGA